MAGQTLPAHLSHKSALILLPPTSIQGPIQELRRKHDKHFNRWPPHVNLIYPFLAKPSGNLDSIRARIESSIQHVKPSTARLDRTGLFQHGKASSTVWLGFAQGDERHESGRSSSSRDWIMALQAKLQADFRDCDADTRAFAPHLSIGQAKGPKSAEGLAAEAVSAVHKFLQEQAPRVAEQEGSEAKPPGNWELDWHIDKVVVVEREAFDTPFEIVLEVPLGDVKDTSTASAC